MHLICRKPRLLLVVGLAWVFSALPSFAQAPPPKLELTEEERKAEQAFSLADGLYRKGFYDRAVEQFLAFVGQYPQHANAALALLQAGEAYFAQKKYAEAIPLYERVTVEYQNSEELDEAEYRIGYSKYHLKDYPGAIVAFDQLLEKAPNTQYRAAALYWAGESYYESQKYAEAIKSYEESRKAAPQGQFAAWATYSIGISQLKLGNAQEAMRSFSTVAEEYSDSPVAAESELRLAEALNAAGRTREAIEAYQGALRQGDGDLAPQALDGLAWLYFGAEDWAKARSTGERLIAEHAQSPYVTSARRCIADCLYRQGKYAEAVKAYEAALEGASEEQAAEILLWQGASHEKLGDAEAAAAVYRRLTTEHPKSSAAVKAAVRLADSSSTEGGDLDAAEQSYKAAAGSDDPTLKAQGQLGLAWVAYKRGDAPAALQQYEVIAKADPASETGGTAALQAAKIAAAAERTGKVAELCSLFLQHHAGHEEAPRVHYLAGVAFATAEQRAEAIKAFEQATAGDAKADFTADALRRLAQLYRQAGDNAKADAALARLREDFPGTAATAEVQFEAARELLEARKYAEARRAFEAALAEAKDPDLAAHCQLGIAATLSEEGQSEQAVAAYQTLIEKYAESDVIPQAKVGLAWAYVQAGEADKAKPLLEEITAAAETPAEQVAPALFRLGEIAYDGQDYETAISRYTELVTDHPQSDLVDEGHYKRAWSLLQLKRSDEAVEAFRQCLAAKPEAEVAADCHFRIGLALTAKNETQAAIDELKPFLTEHKADPLAGSALLALADLYARQEDWANVETAIKAAPDTGEPAYLANRSLLLGRALVGLDRAGEAIEPLTKAADLGEGEGAAAARFELARAQAATGKQAEAAESFLNVAILNSTSTYAPRALFEAGQAFEQAGATDEAKKAYAALLKDYQDAEEWATKAKARLEALGN